MTDILKTKGKLKIMRDNIVDEYVTNTMITKNIKSLQKDISFLINLNKFSYFEYFLFTLFIKDDLLLVLHSYMYDKLINIFFYNLNFVLSFK